MTPMCRLLLVPYVRYTSAMQRLMILIHLSRPIRHPLSPSLLAWVLMLVWLKISEASPSLLIPVPLTDPLMSSAITIDTICNHVRLRVCMPSPHNTGCARLHLPVHVHVDIHNPRAFIATVSLYLCRTSTICANFQIFQSWLSEICHLDGTAPFAVESHGLRYSPAGSLAKRVLQGLGILASIRDGKCRSKTTVFAPFVG
mmetsp:Transcript_16559/g.45879  ORF Transcript_16559/g.45879 Transcript_16559/m.45879 type:complete len:200 (-) Transcript_16559:240-839(-)